MILILNRENKVLIKNFSQSTWCNKFNLTLSAGNYVKIEVIKLITTYQNEAVTHCRLCNGVANWSHFKHTSFSCH